MDVEAIEQDFGAGSGVRILELIGGKKERWIGDERATAVSQDGAESGFTGRPKNKQQDGSSEQENELGREADGEEEEEELTEAEKVQIENNNRIALRVTLRTRGRCA